MVDGCQRFAMQCKQNWRMNQVAVFVHDPIILVQHHAAIPWKGAFHPIHIEKSHGQSLRDNQRLDEKKAINCQQDFLPRLASYPEHQAPSALVFFPLPRALPSPQQLALPAFLALIQRAR